jgi:carbon-monoxide dehydrogenase small subunit
LRSINLNINGHCFQISVNHHETLLEVLRDDLGLTGTKEACDGGECGACTVLLNGKAVLSCLTLAVDAEGKSVVTIEGLQREDDLDQIQKAFIEEGAIQCGFCTAGMILSAKALFNENPRPHIEEIKEAISGNLCRCTGYAKPVRALVKLGEKNRHLGK